MTRSLTMLLVPALFLAGCAMLPAPGKNDLMKQSDDWRKLVRWGDYDKACGVSAETDIQKLCRQQFAGGVTVVDLTVEDVALDDDGKSATVALAVEYLRPPSASLKRTKHGQRWVVKEHRWQLMTPLKLP